MSDIVFMKSLGIFAICNALFFRYVFGVEKRPYKVVFTGLVTSFIYWCAKQKRKN